MTAQEWQRVREILELALELDDPQSRREFVQRACAGDDHLLREVESFLTNDTAARGLEEAAFQAIAGVAADAESGAFWWEGDELSPGTQIGPYKVCGTIGEGGMGRVYLAVRASDFEKQVAIKVMKRGMDTEALLRRFRDERQILARLDHPNIAQLHDGGATADGRPYLVMEYVRGIPISEYCSEGLLGIRERLALFQMVCSAVQYAHQNLIVHRDIKPGNILVNEEGIPKLLDFGIAKLLEPNLETTVTSARPMTPDCASPEQWRGDRITTATDIYSLGVLLYQLLTGERPYRFGTGSFEEIRRVICESEPRKPSTIRAISEDLDNIILKAMHKDSARRYGSAEQLSEDIDRYLAGRPVMARKDTLRYRTSKFLSRHKAGTAAAILVTIALTGGIVVSSWAAHVAALERGRAERGFSETRQLARSVIFNLQSELAGLPGTTQIRKELVGTALRYLDTLSAEAAGDIGLQKEVAEGYVSIGKIQGGANQNLGDWQGALDSFAKAEPIARRILQKTPTPEAYRLLVNVLREECAPLERVGKNVEAEARGKEAITVARQATALQPGNDVAESDLANALIDSAALSTKTIKIALLTEACTLKEAVLARNTGDRERRRNVALCDKYLGAALMFYGESGRAFPLLTRAAELDEQRFLEAPNDPVAKLDWAIDLNQLGEYYEHKDDIGSAIRFTRRSLDLRREIVASNPKDAWAQDRFAYILARLGDLQTKQSPRGALASYQESLTARGSRETRASAFAGAGAAYRSLGDNRNACNAYREAVNLFREVLKSPARAAEYAAQAAASEKAYSECSGSKPVLPGK